MVGMHVLIGVAVFVHVGSAARILGIVPSPSYSHQVVFQPLWRELSLRGHQVTTLTTDPIKDSTLTNLTEIDLHFSYEAWNKIVMENVLSYNDNVFGAMLQFMTQIFDITDEQLRDTSVQKLLKPLMTAMFAFVEKFQCPFISMLSMDGFSDHYKLIGNPTHPVMYPDVIHPYDDEMPFSQRLTSVVSFYTFSLLTTYGAHLQDQLIKKHFGLNYSSVNDIMRNASMLFVNSDPIFHKIRPLVPAVVQIGGGSHLRPPKPLPHVSITALNTLSK
ncbi:hypothetical protein RI129_000057 [Pyrocoelia pectoralis]|uniref:UDP-glucuronosyltransferase n=1 Tax=Pyrocoelia pectoralis TaxID=417401 RepID=A0AAN7ZBN5_9COLE